MSELAQALYEMIGGAGWLQTGEIATMAGIVQPTTRRHLDTPPWPTPGRWRGGWLRITTTRTPIVRSIGLDEACVALTVSAVEQVVSVVIQLAVRPVGGRALTGTKRERWADAAAAASAERTLPVAGVGRPWPTGAGCSDLLSLLPLQY